MITVTCEQCKKSRTVKKQPDRDDCLCRSCSNKNYGRRHRPAEPMYRTCSVCGDKKRVTATKSAILTVCRKCYVESTMEARTTTCIDCGTTRTCKTERDARAKRCIQCSRIEQGIRRRGIQTSVPKVAYWYFCSNCPTVVVRSARHRRVKCTDCARRTTKIEKDTKIYFDLEDMKMIVVKPRMFRFCSSCGDTKEVYTLAAKRPKKCRKCSLKEVDYKARAKKTAVVRKKTVKPRVLKRKNPKVISQEAILRVRAINKEHHDRMLEIDKREPKQSLLSDEDMVAKFLSSSEPSVVANNDETIPYSEQHRKAI